MKRREKNSGELGEIVDTHLRLFSSPPLQEMERAEELNLHQLRSANPAMPSRSVPPAWRLRWAVAAALAIVVLIPAAMLWQSHAPAVLESAEGTRRIQYGEVVRSDGKDGGDGSVLILRDGSRVEVRSKSELALETADDGVRIRLNGGSVIVTAAKQRAGHLYVQTKDITVSVVGTVFLVNAEAEGSRVAVIQGEVHVQQGATSKKLLPGEQVTTNPLMEAQPVSQEIAWSPSAPAHLALLQQSVALPAEARDIFDVVSIRLMDSNASAGARGGRGGPSAGGGCADSPQADPGRIVFNNNTNLYTLIAWAYGMGCVEAINVGRISGGPSWVGTDQYLIQATIPKDSGFLLPTGQFNADRRMPDFPKLQKMLQNMLADRFKLAVHRDIKEMPGYELRVAKGGSKLRADMPSEAEGLAALLRMGPHATMGELALVLTRITRSPVLDRTGITEGFPIVVFYPPSNALPDTSFSIFDALKEQLGLEVVSIKAQVGIVVIDHAEKPSEN